MTTGSASPSADKAGSSVNADWIHALQRTAPIAPASDRTLAASIAQWATTRGSEPALVGTRTTLSYAELTTRANRYARWGLRQGLVKGDRVALLLSNQPDYVAIWVGLSGIGVVTALLNTELVGNGLAHCLSVADAKHLIVGSDLAGALADIAFSGACWIHGGAHPDHPSLEAAVESLSCEPLRASEVGSVITLQDEALLIYTSGTTGLPKAARVSHYRIIMWSEWFAGIMHATSADRLYNCLPMYHSIGGVVAVGAMLVCGGAVIVREGFSARGFWQDVAASDATIFQYIGELCRYLLASEDEAVAAGHKLRLCIGNGLRGDVWDRFAARFVIPRIIEFYASTEGSFSLFNLEGRPGAIGRIPRFMAHRSPVALVAFDVQKEQVLRDARGLCRRCAPGETGEAIGRITRGGSNFSTRFEGYTSEIETQRKILRDVFEPGDMWFRTGDLMRQDAAGFFYFVDRIGDTFRWKGENVATSEVAEAIATCAGVLDVAVYGVGVPHADGRAGMAALTTEPDFDPAHLRAHLAARLPRAARPVFLRLREQMTLTGTFKLKKHDLMREGFDPSRTRDTLLVEDPAAGAYVPIDLPAFARIAAGAMRL